MLRALLRDGWMVLRQRGSHVHLHRTDDTFRVTVAIGNRTLKPKTPRSILDQAGMSIDQLKELL